MGQRTIFETLKIQAAYFLYDGIHALMEMVGSLVMRNLLSKPNFGDNQWKATSNQPSQEEMNLAEL